MTAVDGNRSRIGLLAPMPSEFGPLAKACALRRTETAAIAAVCERRGVRWSAVRSISDLVGVTPGDVIGLANADGTPNIAASMRYLVTKPWRIPKLVRLGVDSQRAARAAAEAAAH